jgi:hypothetical protein
LFPGSLPVAHLQEDQPTKLVKAVQDFARGMLFGFERFEGSREEEKSFVHVGPVEEAAGSPEKVIHLRPDMECGGYVIEDTHGMDCNFFRETRRGPAPGDTRLVHARGRTRARLASAPYTGEAVSR